MDKISITVNGKTFEAEGKDLFEIIDNFLNGTDKEEQYNDVPKEYDNYEEYLSLEDFNPAKCTTKEQLDDLKKKLENRIVWLEKHPNADLQYVKFQLNDIGMDIYELLNKVDNIRKAYQEVIRYIDQVNAK